MKNFNLIKRLWTDSHEKQSPQRFARCAAILIMLLTLGVGQMWAKVVYYNDNGQSGTPKVHFWGGSPSTSWATNPNMVHISGNIYAYDIGTNTSCIFRYNNANSQTGDLTVPSNSNNYMATYNASSSTSWSKLSTFSGGTTLYLLVNSDWKSDGARFAACFLGVTGQSWVDCSRVGTSDYYSVAVPSGEWPYVIFCRMDGSKAANNWDNRWNQTSDLAPSSGNNGVEITGWDNSSTWRVVYTGISVSRTPTAAANAPTITNSQTVVKSGSSVTINAQTEKTGYHWVNWTKTSGTLGNASNKSTTFTPSANSASAVANYAANTYTVAYNANDDQYPGTATGSTSSSSHTYGTAKALTSNGFSRAGYTFAGWATTPTGSVAYTNGQSVTNLTSTHGATVTLYAKWTENKSTITLVASPSGKGTFQVGGETVTSTQAGVTTTPSVTAYPISGYRFTGWSISGGASISSTSDNPTTVTGGGAGTAATLTATFEENLVYYDVTFGVGTSYTSLGSISATNNTTSSAISSGDDLLSASSVTFTATPNTGYTVEGWYTNAACTEGKHDAGSTTYTIASLSSDVTVYVKFVEKTWSVAFAAGTGGTVTTPAATPQTVGQLTGISIAATPGTGYTFNTWTITSGSGSFTSAVTTNSNKFKPTSASTITASFNETKSTITVTTATSSQGTLKFGGTSKSWGATASLGVTTTQNITATAAAGFRFVRWDLSGAAASSSTLTNTTITLKADGSGSTGTATAVFEEDLSSPWIVAGGNKIVTIGTTWRTTADANNSMVKKTGHSTESVVYFTVPVTTVCSGDNNENFQFKIYNTSTSTWYGLFASGSYYLLKKEDGTEKSLLEGNQNIELRAYVTGNYEFKLDYSTSTPKLTVTWPVFNQVRISAASPSDATNVGNFDLSDPVSNVRSVKRTLNASTTYTFKIVYNSDFYGYNSGTFTRSTSTSSNSRTISTSGGDMTLTTDYAGDYTFKFNQSTKALSVDFPEAYKITFGKGSVDGTTGSFSAVDLDNDNSAVTSNSTWVKSGNRVKITAPSAKSGYRFLGWYDNNSATGDAITTLANCTITVNTTKTVYACYALKQSALTLDKQTSATGYGSAGTVSTSPGSATYGSAMPALSGTMPTAAAGYKFMGFYDATGGGGTKYYNADGSSAHTWDKDVTTGTMLYAYYKKAEITELTFDAASVEAGGEVGVTPTIDPVPEPTVSVCWRVLYNNDNPLDPQPEISWDGTKATFTAPLASGTYKVEAKLRTGSSCGGGTLLDTRVASFTVAGTHTVTINYKCGDDVIKASTTTTGRPFDWSGDITAPDIFGYTFSSWTAGDGITIKDGESSTATTHIKATYNGTLTANYTQKSLIYFKNTLGWSDVYVNFYTGAKWNNPKGSGNKDVTNRNKHMTRIGDSDVWYYDYGAESISPSLYVSFTSVSQENSEYFWYNPVVNVVYPANYPDAINTNKSSENGFKAATPMFVPLATQDGVTLNSSGGGKANYYNAGYWTKYTPGTGYRLEIYNSAGSVFIKAAEFTSGDDLMPMTAVVDLEGNHTYKFQLRRGGESSAGIYYGNSGTMTYASHGQDGAWDMTNSSFSMCGINTTAAGNYTFHLSYGGHPLAEAQYRLRMAVDYPVASGDYRLIYTDNTRSYLEDAETKYRYKPSAIVQKVNNSKDTVSFFIRPGQTPVMKIQQATVNGSTGAITWSAGTDVSSSISALSKDSVYNICLTMDENGAISVENVAVYTGNFYIRTDAANSKWDNYRSDPDHRMTYSEYSITHGGYSHYYCHWVQADDSRKNVKFVIANDYSPCISDTLTRETASGTWANIEHHIDEYGNILRNANVRFMWNQHDNTVSRAYVDGAQGTGSNIFLYILSEDGKIKKSSGSALDNNKVQFSDNGNWIYEANIKAQPDAAIKLLSNWSDSYTITQYFKGSSSETETLIGGSGETWYDIRVIYDYKTNRLVAAWIPSGEIGTETNINADVMFIREHQGDIAQLTFNGAGAIKKIETAYGVLRFNKWTLNNKDKSTHTPLAEELSRYERDLFYVSFPFRVSMEEVFGFGTYGTHWIIEYYDGAGRAANGYWAESGPNWKFITNRKGKFFEPYEGYIIALDLDELGESSDVWANTDQVELYFPSYGEMPNITNASYTHEIPAHLCTINWCEQYGLADPNYDRRVKDSHWNVLSVPTYVNTNNLTFANTTWITTADDTHVGPNFLYEWNPADNSVTARSGVGYNYHAMHAYLVQYCGNVTWTSSVSPALAPRRNAAYRGDYEFRLEIKQNDEAVDQTFVKLSDNETVTTGFEFNYDLSKEFNKNKANIYTLIGTEQVAGNCLPLTEQTTVVPVGVKIAVNGDYTFAIPDGTNGIGVTLIDTENNIRTSLSALSYTVNLTAGTHDGRFLLEIAPIQQTPTDIEEVTGDGLEVTGARKVIIDQKMYIIRDGKMYDARGARVQ